MEASSLDQPVNDAPKKKKEKMPKKKRIRRGNEMRRERKAKREQRKNKKNAYKEERKKKKTKGKEKEFVEKERRNGKKKKRKGKIEREDFPALRRSKLDDPSTKVSACSAIYVWPPKL